METAFSCNIENMVILYHSIIGESLALEDLRAGGLSRSDINNRSEVILQCLEVFENAAVFPGVGIA
jgi:hypothetical protein